MANNDTTNLFALLDDAEAPIRRIPLTNDLSISIKDMFSHQLATLIENKQNIEFTGSYNVDLGEIFTIADYPLPENIPAALSNPLACPVLNLTEETHQIKSLFTGVWAKHDNQVSFQVFDAGKLLSKGLTIIGSGNTFKKLEDPGLVLQDKLTAHYNNGTLYFASYHNTKRFLDLTNYYKEATDLDLDTFASSTLFEFENEALFKTNADSIIRKKVALLQKNNVLQNLSIEDIQTVANSLNQDLPEQYHIKISISNGKLVIPTDRKHIKDLLRFLDEDYVTAPLTKRKCLTNSKKYL